MPLTHTISGNARFDDDTPARLVLGFNTSMIELGRATPDPNSIPPGDYSLDVESPTILQAHLFDPANLKGIWQADTVYAVGDVIFSNGDTNSDSWTLECVATAGAAESGASEPAWDSTVGATTVDNDLTWENLGAISACAPITNYYVLGVYLADITPNTGDEAGGTLVTITGTGFSNFNESEGDAWKIGGEPVTNITVVSDTEMTGETPAGTGESDVVVTIGEESATLVGGFDYYDPSYAAVILADSPTAYYRLEETSGATANDETSSNDGEYWSAPTFEEPGLIAEGGNAVGFDGIDDALTSYVLGTVSAATFECWVSADDGAGSGALSTHILGHRSLSTNANQLLMGLRSDGRIEIRHRNDGSNATKLPVGSAVIDDGEPHHIVLLIDGASNELRLYVDKVLDITSSFTTSSGEWEFINVPITFAAEYQHGDSAPKNQLECVLDEVAIYEQVLTVQQIEDHYDAGMGND